MKSSVVKRSIVTNGHKTSVSLEDAFWTDLKKIAHAQQVTLSELVTKIDGTREQNNLSSAIRLFVLHHFRNEDRRMEVAEAHLSVSAERTPASQP
jgi:predicted DNA-binding ribbon-helix-helix protein